VLRLGASDFIDEAELQVELPEALRRLKAGKVAQGEPGKLFALMGPSGGCGASTLATNLATVLAKEHKSILLMDLKWATGDLASLLDLKPTYSLADLCRNAARMDRVMFERSLTRHASGVHLLALPTNFNDLSLITPEGVRLTLSMARSLFPYVLADLDFSFREEEAQVLRLADLILLVLRLDFSSLRNVQRALEYLRLLGINMERVRIVVNRYGQPKEVPPGKAEQALGIKIAFYVPEDAKTVNRANNNGVPLVLESPASRIARSMANLAHNINGRPPKQRA
jgi:pilus assembly protein CpaE